MARVRIKEPNQYIFSTEIDVSVNMVNYGGHLGNDSVLTIAHDARIQFLRSLNYTEMDIEGSGIIMNDAAVQYISEGKLGDKLKIEIGIEDISKIGLDLIYKITNIESKKKIALVKTGIVFYDYKQSKLSNIAPEFLQKLEDEKNA